MEIFNEFNHNSGLSLALGFFDGVHSGHKKVIETAVDYAKKNSLKSAVIMFSNSPATYFLNIQPKYILSKSDKLKFIEDLGVDYVYMPEFNEHWANLSAEDYLENYLIKFFEPKAITTGFNHNFGSKKHGDSKLLREFSQKFNYEYFEIQPQKVNDEIISSTAIKTALSSGNIELANTMCNRNFSITGEVIYGEQIGRTIGFKTANLEYPNDIADLKNGVYGVLVEVNGEKHKGVLNFGIRPTVSNCCKKTLEVNIFDFNQNIYGKIIKIEFVKKIRDEKKFASINELKEQIEKDSEIWRNTDV